MSIQGAKHSPIVEFLGEDAGVGGPFALLGLKHEIESDNQIFLASTRRLAQIDRHRHRSTPDADEVRLAIHSAASQLLDHALRHELMLRWPPGTPAALPKAWRSKPNGSRLALGVVHNAKMLVAASGGWNTTARKRLVYFARVKRIPALELISALRPQHANPTKGIPPQAEKGRDHVPLVDPPPSGSLVWLSMYAILFVLGASALTMVMLTRSRISMSEIQIDIAETLTSVKVTPGEESSGQRTTQERTEFEHYTAIAHELDQLVVHLQTDMQGSVNRFATLYPLFIENWTVFPSPALDRSGLHIVEFVRRVSFDRPDGNSLIDSLLTELKATPRDEPAKVMIQSAIISILLSDGEIASELRSDLAKAHTARVGFEPTPARTISQALVPIIGLIGVDAQTDEPQWWASWSQGLVAGISDDGNQRDRLVLSILSSRLQDQSPTDQAWERSARSLVNLLAWREGSTERFWLFRQFVDDRVSAQRLAAITEAIAVHSSAPQVNAQMVLNPSATPKQRQQIAQLYRQAWDSSETQSDTGHLSNALASEMHVQVELTPIATDQTQAIKSITQIARLNAAAWVSLQEGNAIDGDDFIDPTFDTGSNTRLQQIVLDSTARDDQWAFDAINALDRQALSPLFAQLVEDDGPGVNSAYALVYLATLNSDADIRSSAASQILRYQNHPSVLIALDRAISGKRVTSRIGQLVSDVVSHPLPDRTSEGYFLQAHAQLVELLVASLAQATDSPLRALESELIASYIVRLDPTAQANVKDQGAVDVAKAIYRQQLRSASSLSGHNTIAGEIQAAMDHVTIRLARSTSPLHTFLAYQRGVCELLAIEIESKHPTEQRQLHGILNELTSRSAQCKSVLDQISQAERCMSQLWIIRLEAEAR